MLLLLVVLFTLFLHFCLGGIRVNYSNLIWLCLNNEFVSEITRLKLVVGVANAISFIRISSDLRVPLQKYIKLLSFFYFLFFY